MDEERYKKEFDLFFETISQCTSLHGKLILDLCSSWGNHTGFLEKTGGEVIAVDIADFSSFFKRNIKPPFEFARMDAQQLALQTGSIDVVFCINAFEHIPDPYRSLKEIYRVLKPNGYVFISFIPCYHSDVGSHMSDFIPEPWAHLIYNEEEYLKKLKLETPGTDYWVNEFKNSLNRKTYKYFKELFSEFSCKGRTDKMLHFWKPCFKILVQHEWRGTHNPNSKSHTNFEILRNLYSEDELLFLGMYLLMKKI